MSGHFYPNRVDGEGLYFISQEDIEAYDRERKEAESLRADVRLRAGLEYLSSRKALKEIKEEAQSEIYGGELDLGHVGMGDLIRWMQLEGPRYEKVFKGDTLASFDVLSVLRMFEEWVHGKHDAELEALNPEPESKPESK